MSRNEIHIFLRGGLGNQLFQYALGLHVSVTQDKDLVIREDLLPESEDHIAGVSRWPNQISHFEHSGQNWCRSHQPPFDTNIFGKYMQAQRILGDASPSLLRGFGIYGAEASGLMGDEFSPYSLRVINGYASTKRFAQAQKESISVQVHALKNPSRAFETLDSEIKATSPIVVHLRLGDYLSLSDIYGNISIEYLRKGLSVLLGSQRPVWVFTQHSEEVGADLLEAIAPERIVDSQALSSPLENMLLMSHGGGLICSNSSLSWWAAFLSNSQQNVVVPRYPGRTNAFGPTMTLDGWKVLDVD